MNSRRSLPCRADGAQISRPPAQQASQWVAHLTWILASAFVGVIQLAPTPAVAALRTWTGASLTSGNWSSAANWDAGVPTTGDILNFSAGALRKTANTNNLPAGMMFSTINLFGTGWHLRGNSVTITNYLTAGNPAGTNIIDNDVIAGGPAAAFTLSSFSSAARLTLNGDVILNTHNLHTDGPGDFVIAGVISGPGGIFKANTGDLSLAGLGANTFTGTTVVAGGILRLNRYTIGGGLTFSGTTAIPGTLSIGGFNSTLIGDIAVLERENQISDSSVVAVNSTGSLELSDENDTIGELRLYGGTVSTGTGTLWVDGPIVAGMPLVVNKDSVIAGHLNLGGRGAGPQMVDVAQGVQLNITAAISGATTSPLVKTNRGDLWLTSSNSFSGDVVIEGGYVTITDGHALGNTNGVTRPALGQLNLWGTFGVLETLDVTGPAGNVATLSGNASWIGPIRLDDDLAIVTATNTTLSVIGPISGPAGWTKYGDGTLQFKTASTNNYGGTSWVREGGFIMDGVFNQPVVPGPLVIGVAADPTNTTRVWPIKQNQIADTAPVTLNHSGVLDLSQFNDTVGSLIFNGGAVETSSGTLTLNGDIVVNATNESARISGRLSLGGATRSIHTIGHGSTPDLAMACVISDGGAPAGLTKTGLGSVRLTASSTFTGPTTLAEGTLQVDGSLAASSQLQLNHPVTPDATPHATLAGYGSVPSIVPSPDGTVSPGASPGRLTVQGNADLANTDLRIELNGIFAVIGYDQLRATGNVSLNNTRLLVTAGFTPATNYTFLIVDKTSPGPVNGTFNNAPEGGLLPVGGQFYRITYTGGDGNDIVLQRVDPGSVPPALTGISTVTADSLTISGQGAPFVVYVLEGTPSLQVPVVWLPLQTNTANAQGAYQFTDAFKNGGTPVHPEWFYRVVTQ